jgi:hypothetical protein
VSAWPDAISYLWGWVDTSLRGYRKITVGATPLTIASGYRRWPEHITALDSALTGLGDAALLDATGVVQVTLSPAATVTWPDRLGWLMGFGAEPGEVEASGTVHASRHVPPGGIPLLGAEWEGREVTRDDELIVDRQVRGRGYVWGNARVWRWRLHMHRLAWESLREENGWCRRGKVTISGAEPSAYLAGGAWSTSNPSGYLDGHVLGLSEPAWLDELHEVCTVSAAIAAEA